MRIIVLCLALLVTQVSSSLLDGLEHGDHGDHHGEHGHGEHDHGHGEHDHEHGEHGHEHGEHGHEHPEHNPDHGEHGQGEHGHHEVEHSHGQGEHDLSQGEHGHGQGEHDLSQGEHDHGQGEHDLTQGEHGHVHVEHSQNEVEHDHIQEELNLSQGEHGLIQGELGHGQGELGHEQEARSFDQQSVGHESDAAHSLGEQVPEREEQQGQQTDSLQYSQDDVVVNENRFTSALASDLGSFLDLPAPDPAPQADDQGLTFDQAPREDPLTFESATQQAGGELAFDSVPQEDGIALTFDQAPQDDLSLNFDKAPRQDDLTLDPAPFDPPADNHVSFSEYDFDVTEPTVAAENRDYPSSGEAKQLVDSGFGVAASGAEYPQYATVPRTSFSCRDQEYGGYFADQEAQCQVFHVCLNGSKMGSFLCPNGTLFHQQYFVCDWWYNVECGDAALSYGLNARIGVVPEES